MPSVDRKYHQVDDEVACRDGAELATADQAAQDAENFGVEDRGSLKDSVVPPARRERRCVDL